jgi:hypothetical protein
MNERKRMNTGATNSESEENLSFLNAKGSQIMDMQRIQR